MTDEGVQVMKTQAYKAPQFEVGEAAWACMGELRGRPLRELLPA